MNIYIYVYKYKKITYTYIYIYIYIRWHHQQTFAKHSAVRAPETCSLVRAPGRRIRSAAAPARCNERGAANDNDNGEWPETKRNDMILITTKK